MTPPARLTTRAVHNNRAPNPPCGWVGEGRSRAHTHPNNPTSAPSNSGSRHREEDKRDIGMALSPTQPSSRDESPTPRPGELSRLSPDSISPGVRLPPAASGAQ